MRARHFSLTPAEAKLASQLMIGKSLRAAARELNVTYETARTTLRSIFQKQELIAKLN